MALSIPGMGSRETAGTSGASKTYDVVVAGASLDAVTLAYSLAKAGRTVALFEGSRWLGGMLRPVAMPDGRGGHRDSFIDLMPLGPRGVPPAVLRGLELERHGLTMVPVAPPALVTRTGPSLQLASDAHETGRRLDALKMGEGERFFQLRSQMTRVRGLAARFLTDVPVDPASLRDRSGEALAALLTKAGQKGDAALFDLLHLSAVSCADRLRTNLQTPTTRVLICAMALAHQGAGPMLPGSALALLGVPALEALAPRADLWFGARILGGSAALAAALERAVLDAGVDLFTENEVSEILVSDNKVRGVSLWNGAEVAAPIVVSGYDIKKTYLNLMSWKSLPQDLLRAVGRADMSGRVARMAFALSSLDFLPQEWQSAFPSTVYLSDGVTAMEAASDDAHEGRLPSAPWLSLSLHQDGIDAESGFVGVLMASVHCAPQEFHDGAWTNARRETFRNAIINRITAVWPEFPQSLADAFLWLPADLEAEVGRTGGHLLGGDWTPDTLYWNGPLPELSRHDGGIEGLVLCGPDMAVMPTEPGLAGLCLAPRLAAKAAAPAKMRRVR